MLDVAAAGGVQGGHGQQHVRHPASGGRPSALHLEAGGGARGELSAQVSAEGPAGTGDTGPPNTSLNQTVPGAVVNDSIYVKVAGNGRV